jgi:quercetin dioxygenase-like cupin family protein
MIVAANTFTTTGAILPNEIRGLATTVHALAAAAPALSLPPLPALDSRILLVLSGRGSATAASGWTARFDCAGGAATIVLAPGAGAAVSLAPDGAALAVLELVVTGAPGDAAAQAAAAARGAVPAALAYTAATRYTEPCKSAATVSRTLVPRGTVPRFAMGSVEARGPDAVAPHAHPMLEQLFLGLAGCDATVDADGATAALRAGTLLHVPLGSTHGVRVEAGRTLHYVWIDLFHDAAGEAWLEGHKDV